MVEGLDLPQLHNLLRQLGVVRGELAGGPRQIQLREKRIKQGEQIVVDKTELLKQTRAETDRKNLDLKSKEQNLHSLQGKLNAAGTNREYEILQGQIQADTAAKAVLEDEILELLDRSEAVQQDIAKAKGAVVQMQADLKQFSADFDAKLVDLKERASNLEARVRAAEKPIPSDIAAAYRRLVESYGAEALAPADSGTCSECFVNLTAQNKVLLNGGKPMLCPSCGRLLYVAGKS